MAGFTSTDLDKIYGSSAAANKNVKIQKKGDNLNLDMTDFIQLMITQLTNQGIDETVDTSDMLNQMIQMQMVETIATLTDASVMSYAASLVGQKVTVGQFDADGKLQEYYGTVEGTGTMHGNQVIFMDDGKYYQMNEILAVGKLPPKEEEDDKTEGTEKPGEAQKPDETQKPGETQKPDETEKPTEPGETKEPENTERPEGSQEPGETQTPEETEKTDPVEPPQETAGAEGENPEYSGGDGAPDDRGA